MKEKILTTIGTATLILGACSESAINETRKPNIVYVFADQWRASAFGYAGDPNIQTPNIDRLAEESINFVNCVAVCPLCTPQRAALMTGRYPTSSGMIVNDLYLPVEELCMPEILKEAGYKTAYIGKWHLDGHGRRSYIPPERRQGWDYWKAAECEHHNYRSHYFSGDSDERLFWEGYDAIAQTRDAEQYIKDHAGEQQPFILMLSYGPPHPASSDAPEEYRAMYPVENIVVPPNVPLEFEEEAKQRLHHYYAHGSALDQCIGILLRTLEETGIAENTIFIFTSDHGGMLLSHGLDYRWKQVHWAESAHVPFLLRYPILHGQKGRIVETPLNTTDILPTLLGLSKVKLPETIEGEDLSDLIHNNRELPDRSVIYMSVAPILRQTEAHRSVRTNRYTYVRNLEGPKYLFDNKQDPWQMHNMIEKPEYASLQKQMEEKLQAHLQRIGDKFLHPKSYIEKWGYELDMSGAISYNTSANNFKVQSPLRKKDL